MNQYCLCTSHVLIRASSLQEEKPATREGTIQAEPAAEPQVAATENGDATEEIKEKKKKKVHIFCTGSLKCTIQSHASDEQAPQQDAC